MNCMKLTAEQRKQWNRQVKEANKKLDKELARARREAAEIGLNTAENWLKTDGASQMFKALLAVFYYTLHMKRPGKGFDSARGILSLHNDLVEMMNECLTEYCFTSDDDAVFDTGVHIELPPNTVGFLKSKSGLNVKHGITSEGVIDEGYTGSICVKLYNNTTEPYHVKKGDNISQLVILPIVKPKLELVTSLKDTNRGGNGFGSSGR